jgi:glycosyltransferase involved in cell wall biosynthesis
LLNSLDVVVPTFERGARLVATVSRILACDKDALAGVEVIVVDDGSTQPAAQLLSGTKPGPGSSLKVVRQPNSGPARARNAGFLAGRGEVVLFMDDDILPARDLLVRHVLAHRQHPGSVIYGRCEPRRPESPGGLFRLLQRLDRGTVRERDGYRHEQILASGQLSVERHLFGAAAVYRDDLVTPAAEEYELSSRLRRLGIPILRVDGLLAEHDAPSGLEDVCRQQYKHGLGCGEVARKCPETLELEDLATIVDASQLRSATRPARFPIHAAKILASTAPARMLLLEAARVAERVRPQADWPSTLYRWAIASHFIGGVRDGLRRFAP